jgi:uncharacterized protein (DUF697 family)
MTRKPLPKAIRRTTEDLRGIAAGVVADEKGSVPRTVSPHDAFEPEPASEDFSQPVANDQFPSVPVYDAQLAARRRALARKIVERYKNYAAVGGLCPLPIANIAGVTAIIMRMVKKLSDLYQVPFEHDRTRSLIVGLVGGTVPTGVGAATTSTLMWVVPGGLLFGLGAAALTAGALTRGIGLVFIEHFESGAA